MELDEFCHFRKKYENQITKIQRKMDYLLYKDNNFIKTDRFLEDMFLESILVDVRALFMENERYKKNYTIQNSFRINSYEENDIFYTIADGIDQYVKDTLLPDNKTTFFEAVKFYTDKYVAHYDNTNDGDDERKEYIKKCFLDNDADNNGFSLIFTVKAIINYAKETEKSIMFATFEELTKIPEDIEHEDTSILEEKNIENNYLSINNKLLDEILKKSPHDIAWLIGLDVRGIQIADINSEETRTKILNYIKQLHHFDLAEFVIKVKETPNVM